MAVQLSCGRYTAGYCAGGATLAGASDQSFNMKQASADFVGYYLGIFCSAHIRILDVGCGPARYRHKVAGDYIGLDLTDAPYAANQLRQVDVVATATELPFQAGSFDLVFSISSFYQFPDPDKALAEFHRVLQPNGRVLLFDYNRRTQRRLQLGERAPRPCWTQWQLRDRIGQTGFKSCELLAPVARPHSKLEYGLRLLHQELFGTWAIVTGIK